mmetsp:Transcript_11721/g.26080  ORF Transcript_11721/g.26080 Transcript_11721/m.26080 type:complete len:339 (+) Transcript_11721:1279-2295(+)
MMMMNGVMIYLFWGSVVPTTIVDSLIIAAIMSTTGPIALVSSGALHRLVRVRLKASRVIWTAGLIPPGRGGSVVLTRSLTIMDTGEWSKSLTWLVVLSTLSQHVLVVVVVVSVLLITVSSEHGATILVTIVVVVLVVFVVVVGRISIVVVAVIILIGIMDVGERKVLSAIVVVVIGAVVVVRISIVTGRPVSVVTTASFFFGASWKVPIAPSLLMRFVDIASSIVGIVTVICRVPTTIFLSLVLSDHLRVGLKASSASGGRRSTRVGTSGSIPPLSIAVLTVATRQASFGIAGSVVVAVSGRRGNGGKGIGRATFQSRAEHGQQGRRGEGPTLDQHHR